MKEAINNWLAGKRNYFAGTTLYLKYGTNSALKKQFEGLPTPYLKERLESELRALLNTPIHKLQPKVDKVEPVPPSQKGADKVLDAFHVQSTRLHRQMQYKQAELDRYEEDTPEQIAIRGRLAGEILSIEDECNEVWRQRDHYLDTGEVESVGQGKDAFTLPADPGDLARLINRTQRYVRRYKEKALRFPDEPKYAMLLKKYEDLLQQINTAIDANKQKSKGK